MGRKGNADIFVQNDALGALLLLLLETLPMPPSKGPRLLECNELARLQRAQEHKTNPQAEILRGLSLDRLIGQHVFQKNDGLGQHFSFSPGGNAASRDLKPPSVATLAGIGTTKERVAATGPRMKCLKII